MRLGVVAIHDVTPAWDERVTELVARARRITGRMPALLVIPDHHGCWPLARYPDFVKKIRRWRDEGSELILHGYIHVSNEAPPSWRRPIRRLAAELLTSGEGEFLQISESEMVSRLKRGAREFEDLFGERPAGFVAPAWLRGDGMERALGREGFRHHEGHVFIHDLANGRKLMAPAISLSARGKMRTSLSLAWSRGFGLLSASVDVRVTLHPGDLDSTLLSAEIDRMLEAMEGKRRWASYRELLEVAK